MDEMSWVRACYTSWALHLVGHSAVDSALGCRQRACYTSWALNSGCWAVDSALDAILAGPRPTLAYYCYTTKVYYYNSIHVG